MYRLRTLHLLRYCFCFGVKFAQSEVIVQHRAAGSREDEGSIGNIA